MVEWNAAQYTQISALQRAMADEVLALLKLDGTEQVLDIGCGNGKITAQIAERVPAGAVLGIDSSEQMISFASSHFAPADWPRLRFEVADARHLPFKSEFDLIVSFNALHWIPEQDAALHSIHTALRPHGRAQLRLVPKGERPSLEDVLEQTRQSPRWSTSFQDFRDPYLHLTPEQYAARAEQNGLKILHLRTADKAWDFGSREAFFAFGQVTFVAWTWCLPEHEKPDFIADVLDRYRLVACDQPSEENTFKFYQMDITLEPG
ncbi:class I SAM-dependent methyltransferase [Gloeobacter kilaueensis]|uniref:Trans-aconitate 2-methyltransferase n=1 Tax=Gloeobacter kilaueensis (strain ATCC BAA-2537 / CCAP 1431/1 / ULC 316 / JS1) TaxID=1183438 RepID=U5QM92_GLOK1|nr:class I SAM-dependent methyltransferase [Gloeobacter kilaueensis]AGY60031.1 trans-aconitate 2-methyltransferase [Gloeobacter kilaueensis JS1]